MTEQQVYEVLEEYPDFELRRYPDHFVAEVEVGGAFELAGNMAFPRLARYIGGPGSCGGTKSSSRSLPDVE